MRKATLIFMSLVLAAVFALLTPMDMAEAQTNNAAPDGDREYEDGGHEGKSCPSKEGKMKNTVQLT